VALGEQRSDGTEVDMRLGDLLVESKLTEFDFQSAEAAIVEATVISLKFSRLAASLSKRDALPHINCCATCSPLTRPGAHFA
jgi:hypothetical protein